MFELNKNVKLRDEIIFGKYKPEKYLGGIRRFENLNLDRLQNCLVTQMNLKAKVKCMHGSIEKYKGAK